MAPKLHPIPKNTGPTFCKILVFWSKMAYSAAVRLATWWNRCSWRKICSVVSSTLTKPTGSWCRTWVGALVLDTAWVRVLIFSFRRDALVTWGSVVGVGSRFGSWLFVNCALEFEKKLLCEEFLIDTVVLIYKFSSKLIWLVKAWLLELLEMMTVGVTNRLSAMSWSVGIGSWFLSLVLLR